MGPFWMLLVALLLSQDTSMDMLVLGIPMQTSTKKLMILSLQLSRVMKSIAAGPLSLNLGLLNSSYGVKGAEGYSVKFPSGKLGTQLRISVHGPLRPPSLSIPWLGMILILPLGILVQVLRTGYFLHLCPPNPPPRSLETLALVGWPESPHPPASQARSQSMENCGGFSR